ncbi:MAG: hypothetical protein ACYDBW_02170 [Sulfuricaulis sp.]
MRRRTGPGIVAIIGLGTALLAAGCSTETTQRTGFETLQNLRQQECRKNHDSDCQKRESYDEYRRLMQDNTHHR